MRTSATRQVRLISRIRCIMCSAVGLSTVSVSSLILLPRKRVVGIDLLLAHRKNGARHLESYPKNRRQAKVDAAIFTAEDFVEDISKVTDFVFTKARKRTDEGRQLRRNIRAWVGAYPHIMGVFPLTR